MKKLIFIFAGLFLMANVASSQAVDDRAVIPVAVTLNSILRLNVTSGGNIEFNFNTLSDYENGIGTSAAYQTKFNVASSVNWDVMIFAENAALIGTDIIGDADLVDGGAANTMDLDFIGYHIESEGTGGTDYTFAATVSTNPAALNNIPTTVLVGYNTLVPNAGDISRNSFTIAWQCGTAVGAMNGSSILAEGLAADRYATNVFLVLQPYTP